MSNLKSKLLSIAPILFCLSGFSQTPKTVDSLEAQLQACLDKGQFMLGCADWFYSQMDALLNVEYKKLRAKCDSVQKVNLKSDQLKWLIARDKQFKFNRQKVHKEAKKGGYDGGQDEEMILIEKNAMFLRERVIELINKTPDSYSADKYKSKNYKISTE